MELCGSPLFKSVVNWSALVDHTHTWVRSDGHDLLPTCHILVTCQFVSFSCRSLVASVLFKFHVKFWTLTLGRVPDQAAVTWYVSALKDSFNLSGEAASLVTAGWMSIMGFWDGDAPELNRALNRFSIHRSGFLVSLHVFFRKRLPVALILMHSPYQLDFFWFSFRNSDLRREEPTEFIAQVDCKVERKMLASLS